MMSFCIISFAFYLEVFDIISLKTTPKIRAADLSLMVLIVKTNINLVK